MVQMEFMKNSLFVIFTLQCLALTLGVNPLPEKCGSKSGAGPSDSLQAQLGEFPWTVRLKYGPEKHFVCNGFIIHEKFVLTAAQCLSEYQDVLNLTQIEIGEHDSEKDKDCIDKKCAPAVKSVEFGEAILHPSYDRLNKEYDIAIIPLKESIKFNDYVSPVCLVSDESLKTADLASYTLAGWERNPPEYEQLSTIKQKFVEPLFDFHECRRLYGDLNITITDTHLCAAGNHTCASVSGSPLMFLANDKWHAVGIVSFGVSQCKEIQMPTIYTNLHKVHGWIVDTITTHLKK